jgi:hypothetical protein
MPCPYYPPWLDLPNDIWTWVQIMKLRIVQLPPFSCYLIPLGPNILPRTLFSNTLSMCSSLNDLCSHLCNNSKQWIFSKPQKGMISVQL